MNNLFELLLSISDFGFIRNVNLFIDGTRQTDKNLVAMLREDTGATQDRIFQGKTSHTYRTFTMIIYSQNSQLSDELGRKIYKYFYENKRHLSYNIQQIVPTPSYTAGRGMNSMQPRIMTFDIIEMES